MGLLEKLFGGGRRTGQARQDRQGPEVVPLADRTARREFTTELTGTADVNHDGGSRQAVIRRCSVDEETVLMQEPRPRGQPVAIGVWATGSGEQLGYLPVPTVGHIMLHAKRYDFRSTIADMPEQDDGTVGVILRIEEFEKQG